MVNRSGSSMRVVFCGTPDFAVLTLTRLLAEGFKVDLVLTNPDEPSGRGYRLRTSPVKQVAVRAGLDLFQPARLKDATTEKKLIALRPEVIVVVAYGHIVPPWMIELPKFGCINLHASLLPKYRGAAPIQWALIRGETTTGVTTMKIDPGLDTGGILLQREVTIADEDTTETLAERLSAVGAELMVETLRGLERGEIVPRPQDSRLATQAPILKKEHGRIDWGLGAAELAARVRGLRPWPGAFTSLGGKTLQVWSAAPSSQKAPPGAPPGTLTVDRGEMAVVCGGGTMLELRELQLEGRKRLGARDFLNGVRLAPGERLGGD